MRSARAEPGVVALGPDGKVRKFDDLPAQYQRNINYEPPFDRRPGQPPALSNQDVSDIVAFLRTLTDGFERDADRGQGLARELA